MAAEIIGTSKCTYSGTPLIWIPMGLATVSVYTGCLSLSSLEISSKQASSTKRIKADYMSFFSIGTNETVRYIQVSVLSSCP